MDRPTNAAGRILLAAHQTIGACLRVTDAVRDGAPGPAPWGREDAAAAFERIARSVADYRAHMHALGDALPPDLVDGYTATDVAVALDAWSYAAPRHMRSTLRECVARLRNMEFVDDIQPLIEAAQ